MCPDGGKHAKQVKRSSGSDVRAYKEEFIAVVVEMKRALVVEQKEEKMACFYEMKMMEETWKKRRRPKRGRC